MKIAEGVDDEHGFISNSIGEQNDIGIKTPVPRTSSPSKVSIKTKTDRKESPSQPYDEDKKETLTDSGIDTLTDHVHSSLHDLGSEKLDGDHEELNRVSSGISGHVPRSSAHSKSARGHATNSLCGKPDDVIAKQGHFMCWGYGEFGQNGQNSREKRRFDDGFVEDFSASDELKVKLMSCGASHTIVVTESNDVYAWGNGNSGQLGFGNLQCVFKPSKLDFTQKTENSSHDMTRILRKSTIKGHVTLPNIEGVACGGRHSILTLVSGQTIGFGNNTYAQLGYDFREKKLKEYQEKSTLLPPISKKTLNTKNAASKQLKNADKYKSRPQLLNFLSHKRVEEVACGDKHTVFRFQDGKISAVGCNSHGQVGNGTKNDVVAVTPVKLESKVQLIACGSYHTIAITDNGEGYVWGHRKACGMRNKADVLAPHLLQTNNKLISASGGTYHSHFLTDSGRVLSLGVGLDGQLGLGGNVTYCSKPQLIQAFSERIVQVNCGDYFSAAVSENGALYMWGKNCYTIFPEQPAEVKVWQPHFVNKSLNLPVQRVCCGAWHAVCVIGKPDASLLKSHDYAEEDADVEEDEEDTNHDSLSESDCEEELNILPSISKQQQLYERDRTLTIAEFYAPSPDIGRLCSPLDEIPLVSRSRSHLEVKSSHLKLSPRDSPRNSHRLASRYKSPVENLSSPLAKVKQVSLVEIRGSPKSGKNQTLPRPRSLVGQLLPPVKTSDMEATTSPMPQSESEDEESLNVTSKQGSTLGASHPDISSTIHVGIKPIKECSADRTVNNHVTGGPDRQKTNVSRHPSSNVQVSNKSAEHFALPRENTTFTSKQIDFTEMEKLRVKSKTVSPERMLRNMDNSGRMSSQSKTNSDYSHSRMRKNNSPAIAGMEVSPSHFSAAHNVFYRQGTRHNDSNSRPSGRHSEATFAEMTAHGIASQHGLWARGSESSLADYSRLWNSPDIKEEHKIPHTKPSLLKQNYKPTQSIPGKKNDANFVPRSRFSGYILRRKLQITRSDTIIAPLKQPLKPPPSKVQHLQRYANSRNPQPSLKSELARSRLGQTIHRHVSIPGGRAPTQGQEKSDSLAVKGSTSSNTALMNGRGSWHERTHGERVKRAGTPKSPPASVHSSNCVDLLDGPLEPVHLVNVIRDIIEKEGASAGNHDPNHGDRMGQGRQPLLEEEQLLNHQSAGQQQTKRQDRQQNINAEQKQQQQQHNQTQQKQQLSSNPQFESEQHQYQPNKIRKTNISQTMVNGSAYSSPRVLHKTQSDLGQVMKKPAPVSQVS